MRILRKKIRGTRAGVREVAAPAAGDANLLANRFRMINQRHTATTLARACRAEKPRCTGSDDDRIKILLHAANVAVRRRGYLISDSLT